MASDSDLDWLCVLVEMWFIFYVVILGSFKSVNDYFLKSWFLDCYYIHSLLSFLNFYQIPSSISKISS
ncbi:hypothetical protein Pint_13823 [Pistacia integerrima]|uniref:Uncharacterized protein n=1 Tax=Pistacia integerrima TaxID=434235 RepID=A0ACC0Y541_9ROSI|nr:hypothetical protein Pint_13823 [Pistacia integerrima]